MIGAVLARVPRVVWQGAAALIAAIVLFAAVHDAANTRAALKAREAEIARMESHARTQQRVMDIMAHAAKAQAENHALWAASIARIDTRLSSGLREIANAPDSNACAASGPVRVAGRVVRELAETAAAERARPRGDDAGGP